MDLNQNFASLDNDALAAYQTQVRAAFDALVALEDLTDEQVTEAETYADHLDAIVAEQNTRSRAAALRTRFSTEEPETVEEEANPEDDPGQPEQPAEEAGGEDTVEAAVEEEPEPEQQQTSTVVKMSKKVARPKAPAVSRQPITITAAADVPEFPVGANLPGIPELSTAMVNRMRGFTPPNGDGSREDLRHFGVATLHLDFPEDLVIDRHTDDMEVLARAADEHRLPGGSLVAAGGWCAPSETIYDLCAGLETTDGLVSVPEVAVRRGGISFTTGPQFQDLFDADNFLFTEAEVIGGATKPCFMVPCPDFTEERLDVIGLCVKAPILTNVGYPEVVQRWVSGVMTAHQHRVSSYVINQMVTAAGAARVFTGLGATSSDTAEALGLLIDQTREQYRMSMNATLEVIVPFWVKGAIKADLARRNGCCADAISDQQVNALFSGVGANVQFVYNWQPLGNTANEYPTTFQALLYPAGTFVKGTSPVINMNAVYDAASLTENVFTALFFEEGILVAHRCYEAILATLPICNAGRTGAADLTCATQPPEVP